MFPPLSNTSNTIQLANAAYNYAAHSDDDPRNLVCLATTQGLSAQSDGAGVKRLFLHNRAREGAICEYWFEAESSSDRAGGEQVESKESVPVHSLAEKQLAK